MSVDTNDFSFVANQNQKGIAQNMYGISLPMAGWAIGQEYEIAIPSLDHIWIPTLYDSTFGINPDVANFWQQIFQNLAGASQSANGPLYSNGVFNTNPGFGMNAFQWFDSGGSNAGYMIPPTFALRFNSPNNPYLIWGQANSSFAGWISGTTGAIDGLNTVFGKWETMRSISGQITRLWGKLLIPGSVVGPAKTYDSVSNVVLLGSIGFNHYDAGTDSPAYDCNSTDSTQSSTIIVPSSVSGGAFVTPQLNTLSREALETSRPATIPNAGAVANIPRAK